MMRILLLKAIKPGVTQDIYVQSLTQHNFSVDLCQPISFNFINLEDLGSSLQHPDHFSGIIFSSPRTVQAVQQCLPNSKDGLQGWRGLPAYCVGQATADHVRDDLGLKPVGQESGNAANLVKVILEGTPAESKPLLFPCGTLRRETIPQSLQNAGVEYKAVVVYETIQHPDLETNIKQYFDTGDPDVIVFFSPSGVRFSKEYFNKYAPSFDKIKIIAIGPTTKAALEESGYKVAYTAEKPTPESLLETLEHLKGSST